LLLLLFWSRRVGSGDGLPVLVSTPQNLTELAQIWTIFFFRRPFLHKTFKFFEARFQECGREALPSESVSCCPSSLEKSTSREPAPVKMPKAFQSNFGPKKKARQRTGASRAQWGYGVRVIGSMPCSGAAQFATSFNTFQRWTKRSRWNSPNQLGRMKSAKAAKLAILQERPVSPLRL